VVIGETQPEVEEVFISKAKELEAPIIFADQNYSLQVLTKGELSIICPLKGLYQEKNIITSYQAIQLLISKGFHISDEHIRHGYRNVIRQTGLQGRWQIIGNRPKIICDVGHNEAGIRYILQQLQKEKYEKLHWVFGLVNDKDADSILKLLPATATYYFCKANIPRGLDAAKLRIKANVFGLNGNEFSSVNTAYLAAKDAAGKNDLVFVGGSTFVVAEVL